MNPLIRWLHVVGMALMLSPSGSTLATEPAAEIPPNVLAGLDALMDRNISGATPGCAVGVRHGEREAQRAYGQADLERGMANKVDSVFNVGSVSKQFTAAAILLLAEKGKLSLDDSVRKYLPELNAQVGSITIDQLLSHTSGLRDFRATDWFVGRDALPQNNADVLAYAARQQALNHAPGESYLYTNTGYALAALIVERVSGQSFAGFTRERLFEPAGMGHTQWEEDSRRLMPGRSLGYSLAESAQDGKPARFAQLPSARHTIGHGGLLSTIGDMLRWNAALSGNVYGPRLSARLEEPARLRNGFVLDYARGLYVGRHRGLQELQHGGYTGTYTTWVGRYPEAELSIALLCNGDADEVNPHDIADLFLPKIPEQKPHASTDSAPRTEDLSVHSGVYRDTRTGQLALHDFPREAQLTDGRYIQGPTAYEFSTQATQVVQHIYGNASTWKRLHAWVPSAASLREFQGWFHSDELLAGYEVSSDGQQLTITVRGLSDLTVPLRPRAQDVFEVLGLGLLVEFPRNERGEVSGLVLSPNRLHGLSFRKIE